MTYIQTELALTSLVQGSLRSPQLSMDKLTFVGDFKLEAGYRRASGENDESGEPWRMAVKTDRMRTKSNAYWAILFYTCTPSMDDISPGVLFEYWDVSRGQNRHVQGVL